MDAAQRGGGENGAEAASGVAAPSDRVKQMGLL